MPGFLFKRPVLALINLRFKLRLRVVEYWGRRAIISDESNGADCT
jgi:hypothetical protein